MTQGRKSQRYLSGRSKIVGFSGLSTDRHLYVEPGQVEPNLGFPGEKSLPASGTYYKLITVPNGNTYDRYWQEDTPATLVNGITIFDEGTLVGTANTVSKLNFVGAAVTATASGTISTITVTPVSISTLAPPNARSGDLWWDSDEGELNVYYQDANSAQWVIANSGIGTTTGSGSGGGGGGSGGANVTVSSNPPGTASNGDLWWDSDVGELYIYYTDDDSNQWVETSGGSETVTISDSAPSSPNDGDLWWESDTGSLKIYYNDGDSQQWVDANAGVLSSVSSFLTWSSNSAGINTTSNVGIGTTNVSAVDSSNTATLAVGIVTAHKLFGDGSNLTGVGGTVVISTSAPSSADVGDLWWDSDDGDLLVYFNDGSGSQWVSTNSGGVGAQGAAGAAGAQGATGGAQGAVGAQGAQGASGSAGSAGAQGAQGHQGQTGSGSTGAQGAQGNTGSNGSTGAQGAQGVAGTAASQGAQGAQGFQGAAGGGGGGGAGAQGAQGHQGHQGDTGAGGSAGAQGAQGHQGSGGSAGSTGAQGAQGVIGARSYTVTNNSSSNYVIDGANNPTLNLLRGFTYIFNMNAAGHGFGIQTSSGTWNSSNEYTTGITNPRAATGTIIFAVPYNAPSTLYYACTSQHSGMVGTISISNVGPTGAQGAQGSGGTAGAQGAQGQTGSSGSAGAQGSGTGTADKIFEGNSTAEVIGSGTNDGEFLVKLQDSTSSGAAANALKLYQPSSNLTSLELFEGNKSRDAYLDINNAYTSNASIRINFKSTGFANRTGTIYYSPVTESFEIRDNAGASMLSINSGINASPGSVVTSKLFIPNADDSLNCGSSSLRWSEVHAVDFYGNGSNLTGISLSSSRATANATTSSIANNASANITIAAAKTYALLKIQTSAAAWVTLYTDSTSRSNDSSRNETTDPTPGSGVIAEVITTGAATQIMTPGLIGWNNDGTVSTNVYAKVVNKSGSTGAITVTLHYVTIES